MAASPENIERLFLKIVELPREEREAALDRECGDQSEVRRRVAELLAAHEEPNSFLDGFDVPLEDTSDSQIPGTADYSPKVGAGLTIASRYTLRQQIGEGGMGEVWVAKQSEPVKRNVALKLIKTGMDSRAVLRRFEQERQALAMMDHPNIARVFDGGITSTGQPFFVMELVNGRPLNKFCDEAKLSPNERLELFVLVCKAVQHAHQKGIVHRDLKPTNILVTMIDGKPVPKVIDFGVAKATSGKLTEETMSTGFGAVVGTLEYMSPEQAAFSNVDIDTRADIYSLGVILYEMLTGLRPIDGKRLKQAALTEMIRIIREEEPSKPSTRLSTDESLPSLAAVRRIEPKKLTSLLRGELDWVVLKCLEKQRDRRYETANALARDLQRFLNDEPVEARPLSRGYKLKKFYKRNKGPVIASALVMLALVAGIIGTSCGIVYADRARRAESMHRQLAEDEKKKAKDAEAIANEQRARAESREQLAIDAVKRFADVVSEEEQLKNDPALENLRTRLLKEPLHFFENLKNSLQADNDTRPASLYRLAKASGELGALTRAIGDQQDALAAYIEGLEMMQKLVDAHPNNTEFMRELAYLQSSIGLLLTFTGRQAEAIEAFASLEETIHQLSDIDPANSEFRSFLAEYYSNMAIPLGFSGKQAEAQIAYEKSLEILQELSDSNPAISDYRAQLAKTRYNHGLLLAESRKGTEAMTAFELALELHQTLVTEEPTVLSHQYMLSMDYTGIGRVFRETGNPTESLEAYNSAIEIVEAIVEAHPTNTGFQQGLAGLHNNVGNVMRDIGEPRKALDSLESALAISQKLADDNPTVTGLQLFLANHHHNVGLVLWETGNSAEALDAFTSALEIRQKLAEDNAINTTSFQLALADNFYLIGATSIEVGNTADALEAYEAELAIRQSMADAEPTDIDYQINLADCHYWKGALLVDVEKPAEALKAFEAELAIRKIIANTDPSVTENQYWLADSHHNVAKLLSETGEPDEALKAFDAELAIRQKMAEANPTITDYQTRLADCHGMIAELLVDTSQIDEARKALESALEIEQKLARENSESPDFAHRLAGTLNDMATLNLEEKRYEEAREFFRKAVESQRKALAIDPENPQYRQCMDNHLSNLIETCQELGDSSGVAEAQRELEKLRDSDSFEDYQAS